MRKSFDPKQSAGQLFGNSITFRGVFLFLYDIAFAIIHGIVVGRASSIVEAVSLEKGESVERPVRRIRFDHVEVRQEQNRPGASRAAVAGDDSAPEPSAVEEDAA